jgi:hypothetical protein
MATGQDLKAARREFDWACGKAVGSKPVLDPGLRQLRNMTLNGLDDLPMSEQIEILHDATVRFRNYVVGTDDLSDLPDIAIGSVPKL